MVATAMNRSALVIGALASTFLVPQLGQAQSSVHLNQDEARASEIVESYSSQITKLAPRLIEAEERRGALEDKLASMKSQVSGYSFGQRDTLSGAVSTIHEKHYGSRPDRNTLWTLVRECGRTNQIANVNVVRTGKILDLSCAIQPKLDEVTSERDNAIFGYDSLEQQRIALHQNLAAAQKELTKIRQGLAAAKIAQPKALELGPILDQETSIGILGKEPLSQPRGFNLAYFANYVPVALGTLATLIFGFAGAATLRRRRSQAPAAVIDNSFDWISYQEPGYIKTKKEALQQGFSNILESLWSSYDTINTNLYYFMNSKKIDRLLVRAQSAVDKRNLTSTQKHLDRAIALDYKGRYADRSESIDRQAQAVYDLRIAAKKVDASYNLVMDRFKTTGNYRANDLSSFVPILYSGTDADTLQKVKDAGIRLGHDGVLYDACKLLGIEPTAIELSDALFNCVQERGDTLHAPNTSAAKLYSALYGGLSDVAIVRDDVRIFYDEFPEVITENLKRPSNRVYYIHKDWKIDTSADILHRQRVDQTIAQAYQNVNEALLREKGYLLDKVVKDGHLVDDPLSYAAALDRRAASIGVNALELFASGLKANDPFAINYVNAVLEKTAKEMLQDEIPAIQTSISKILPTYQLAQPATGN